MGLSVAERRRIAVLGDRGRFDLRLDPEQRLGEVLHAGGLLDPARRQSVIDARGRETPLPTPAAELVEGGLYTVVDLSAPQAAGIRPASRTPGRADHDALSWLLAVAAPLLLALALATAGGAMLAVAAGVLGLGAVAAATVAARREPVDGAVMPLPLIAPLGLAFAAGALAVPAGLAGAGELRVAAGLLAAGLLGTTLTVVGRSPDQRAATGTVTGLLVALALVWGVAPLLGLPASAAAAVSLGFVPLVLRALPSTLLDLPGGAFIDYRHFMSNRWTVRGAIPEPSGPVRAEAVRTLVDGSSARLFAGTLAASAVAVLAAPAAFLGEAAADGFVVAGRIALICCLLVCLLLTPRHTTGRVLRWMPRAAAAAVLVVAAVLASESFGAIVLLAVAAALFLAAVVAAAAIAPIARGAASLVWSRIGDVVESLAVALAMPAALLAADLLTVMRGMMAG